MKYKKEILEGFKRIGYSPIHNQVDNINKVLISFIDEGYKNVVLSASTGIGKSVLGIVIAEAYTIIMKANGEKVYTHSKSGEALSSLILMHNNMLVEQYHQSFEEINDWEKIFLVKGASNYTCGHLPNTATAEDCIKSTIFNSDANSICNECEFNLAKKRKNKTNHLITNYAYFFQVSQIQGMEILAPRTMTIWDEAHIISDSFSNSYTIDINDNLFKALTTWFERLNNEEFVSILKSMKKSIPKTKGKLVPVGYEHKEYDYKKFIEHLQRLIGSVMEVATAIANDYLEEKRMDEYLKMTPMIRGMGLLLIKFGNFLEYAYEHTFQWNDGFGFVIKPIFIEERIFEKTFDTSIKNLFMSATVSKEFLVKTIGIKPEETKEIKLDPVFPPENKPFVYVKPVSLNYKSLQDPDIIDHLVNVCEMLLDHHDGDSGIIITPSFKLSNSIGFPLINKKKYNIIIHKAGEAIVDIVDEYKARVDAGDNVVLISPSLYEGVNLPDGYCRFQILTKAPYGSLADERMKYILNTYPCIFNLTTIMKLVQGAGRGVRSITDFCTTYALDSNIKKLFNSKPNIWKDEFVIEEF